MTKQEIEDAVIHILANRAWGSESAGAALIAFEDTLRETLQLDQVDIDDLHIDLENRFGIQIYYYAMDKLITVGDVVTYITDKLSTNKVKMTDVAIKDTIREMIALLMHIDVCEVSSHSKLKEDLRLSEYDTGQLQTNLEKEFGIHIYSRGLDKLKTVGDVATFITSKLKEPKVDDKQYVNGMFYCNGHHQWESGVPTHKLGNYSFWCDAYDAIREERKIAGNKRSVAERKAKKALNKLMVATKDEYQSAITTWVTKESKAAQVNKYPNMLQPPTPKDNAKLLDWVSEQVANWNNNEAKTKETNMDSKLSNNGRIVLEEGFCKICNVQLTKRNSYKSDKYICRKHHRMANVMNEASMINDNYLKLALEYEAHNKPKRIAKIKEAAKAKPVQQELPLAQSLVVTQEQRLMHIQDQVNQLLATIKSA